MTENFTPLEPDVVENDTGERVELETFTPGPPIA
jgi:hypothetical protein